jgi:hypothetical protein
MAETMLSKGAAGCHLRSAPSMAHVPLAVKQAAILLLLMFHYVCECRLAVAAIVPSLASTAAAQPQDVVLT